MGHLVGSSHSVITPSECCSATASRNAVTSSGSVSTNRYPSNRRSTSWPGSSGNRSSIRMLSIDSRMLISEENW